MAVTPSTQLAYLQQDCQQTLQEALEEYFASIPGLVTEDNAPKATADLFRRHDIGHVVFGCDTSLMGEPLADIFCICGSDVRLSEYMEYSRLPEAQQVFKEAGLWALVDATIRSIPGMFVALWRCYRMPRKWPFWDNDAWLDVPLNELRAHFGIRVVRH